VHKNKNDIYNPFLTMDSRFRVWHG
jgi:hypothetical protein